jgi:hypothetical protein
MSKRESKELMKDPPTRTAKVEVEDIPGGTDIIVNLDGMRFQIGRRVAEDLTYALTGKLRPYAGYSIFDRIMQALDPVMDRLMAQDPSDDGRDPGRAEMACMALAMIRNPYQPDYPGEKKIQMERWANRNAE